MFNRIIPELKVSDFDKSHHFYISHLGFKDLGGHFREQRTLLAREEAQLYLQFDNDVSTSTTYFRFKALKPIYDALCNAGIAFLDEPETAWLVDSDDNDVVGLYQFRIADPDGNILVFNQELLPLESDTPAAERMEQIESSAVLEKVPSALEKTMAFREQTLQLAFDTSKYLDHMFHLIQSKQEFSSIVSSVFGISINLDIVSLPRQEELEGDLESGNFLFDFVIKKGSILDSFRQLSTFLDNEQASKRFAIALGESINAGHDQVSV